MFQQYQAAKPNIDPEPPTPDARAGVRLPSGRPDRRRDGI
jgi:hypothetical protein